MKRILIAFISILIVLSSFSICVFAEDAACISLADIKVKPGETVEMPIEISNNKGIWGLVFNVCFDTNAFSVKEVRSTGETFNKSDIMIGPADFSVGYVRVVVTPGDVMNNNTNNGTICTIVLEQTDKTVATTYPFIFDYEKTDFCDVDANYVTVSSVDGSVSVIDENNNKTDSNEKSTVANKSTVSEETKNTDEIENNNSDVLGDVIAKATNNKIIDEYAVEQNQPKTEIVTEYKTNEKGEVVTNKKGEKEVIEKVIEITEKNSQENVVDLSDENKETAQAIGSTGNTNVLLYYILSVLVVAGLVVLIVVLVKKHANKE